MAHLCGAHGVLILSSQSKGEDVRPVKGATRLNHRLILPTGLIFHQQGGSCFIYFFCFNKNTRSYMLQSPQHHSREQHDDDYGIDAADVVTAPCPAVSCGVYLSHSLPWQQGQTRSLHSSLKGLLT